MKVDAFARPDRNVIDQEGSGRGCAPEVEEADVDPAEPFMHRLKCRDTLRRGFEPDFPGGCTGRGCGREHQPERGGGSEGAAMQLFQCWRVTARGNFPRPASTLGPSPP